jgi:hypothetical protein
VTQPRRSERRTLLDTALREQMLASATDAVKYAVPLRSRSTELRMSASWATPALRHALVEGPGVRLPHSDALPEN